MLKRKDNGVFEIDRDFYKAAKRLMYDNRSNLIKQIRKFPCITGYGLGLQRRDGELTGKLNFIVGVIKKEPLKSLPIGDVIPAKIEVDDPVSGKRKISIETDVIETGYPRLFGIECDRNRPARPGDSISHFNVTSGTLGCWVIEKETYKILFLSNNHVLADSNRGNIGDMIYQPGTYCAGTAPDNKYAKLHNFISLNGNDNYVDAAVGAPIVEQDPNLMIVGIGEPTGTIDLDDSHLGVRLSGFGNRSGVHTGSTRNELLSVDYVTAPIYYGDGGKKSNGPFYSFVDQILLDNTTNQPYIPGDSGTVYVLEQDDDVLVAGLNFAGSSTVAIGNHIKHVLDGLKVDICVASAATDEPTAHIMRTFRNSFLKETPLEKSLRQALVRLGPNIAVAFAKDSELQNEWKLLSQKIVQSIQDEKLRPDCVISKPLIQSSRSFLHKLMNSQKAPVQDVLKNSDSILEHLETHELKTAFEMTIPLPKSKKK